jgi:hypothetical protein
MPQIGLISGPFTPLSNHLLEPLYSLTTMRGPLREAVTGSIPRVLASFCLDYNGGEG